MLNSRRGPNLQETQTNRHQGWLYQTQTVPIGSTLDDVCNEGNTVCTGLTS